MGEKMARIHKDLITYSTENKISPAVTGGAVTCRNNKLRRPTSYVATSDDKFSEITTTQDTTKTCKTT